MLHPALWNDLSPNEDKKMVVTVIVEVILT